MSERLRARQTRRSSDLAPQADGVLLTLAAAGVPVAVTGPDGTIISVNASFADRLGTSVDALTGQPLGRAFGDRVDLTTAVDRVAAGIDTIGRSEIELAGDGTTRRIALTIGALHSADSELRLLAVIEDLLTARPVDPRGQTGATTDGLTGLPGRVAFEALLTSSLRRARRVESPFTLVLCSIDRLRELHDELGERGAEVVIEQIGHRLTHLLRHHDVLGRLGANEFGVIAESVDDLDVARIVARRLQSAAQEPIDVNGREVRASLSVGLTLAGGLERPSVVLAEADRALRAAESTPAGSPSPRIVAVTDLIAGETSAVAAGVDPAIG